MTTTTRRRRKFQQRLFLDAVSWRAYERLGRVFQDRPLRITYDRGRLEIMTLTTKHEFWKHAIRRLIEALVEETDNQIAGYGSMTFKRQLKKRGLEPDECFWIQNESAVRGRADFQIDEVPPPDLVLEIEVSRSVIDRIGIYAAFGVPEIWRCNGETLTVCRLVDGEYQDFIHQCGVSVSPPPVIAGVSDSPSQPR